MSRPRLLTTVSALTGLLALTLVFGTAAFPLMTEPEPASVEEPARVGEPVRVGEIPASVEEPISAEKPVAEEPSGQEPRRIRGDVSEPRAIYKLQPAYPATAVKARVQGTVIVESVIDTQGAVVGLTVLKSDREDLAAAAVKAIRQWRFEPATVNGKPVDVYYNLTVNFRLA
ncbi:MAG: energy transducer TonB [bacterium]|nr:energy transducer TonB [bacterium]